jgi:DNA-binding MarR family transcriptional regulator
MTDEELGAGRAEVFGTVFLLAQHLTRRTDAALDDWGLTSRQWLLLAALQRGFPDRDPSLSEAAELYGTSRQNVKQIALGLAERGWLRLEPDSADARTTRLVRTDLVRRFDSAEGRRRTASLLDDVFAGLPRDDVEVLRRLLARWLQALAPAGTIPPR